MDLNPLLELTSCLVHVSMAVNQHTQFSRFSELFMLQFHWVRYQLVKET